MEYMFTIYDGSGWGWKEYYFDYEKDSFVSESWRATNLDCDVVCDGEIYITDQELWKTLISNMHEGGIKKFIKVRGSALNLFEYDDSICEEFSKKIDHINEEYKDGYFGYKTFKAGNIVIIQDMRGNIATLVHTDIYCAFISEREKIGFQTQEEASDYAYNRRLKYHNERIGNIEEKPNLISLSKMAKEYDLKKILVKPDYYGVKYHMECPYCGLNTNLLSEKDRVHSDDGRIYCLSCYEGGKDKKTVKPSDFYMLEELNVNGCDMEYQRKIEMDLSYCPKLELAHLYGRVNEADDFYLDLIHHNSQIYFRACISNDDDSWFGTESYKYISPEQAAKLLNKNGIHILDGINELNWPFYFSF